MALLCAQVSTEMIFSVRRNEYAPQFANSLYEKNIAESFPLGVVILQVVATDRDQVSERWRRAINA